MPKILPLAVGQIWRAKGVIDGHHDMYLFRIVYHEHRGPYRGWLAVKCCRDGEVAFRNRYYQGTQWFTDGGFGLASDYGFFRLIHIFCPLKK